MPAGSRSVLPVLLCLLAACSRPAPPAEAVAPALVAQFVGSQQCQSCHAEVYRDWTGSHHQLAMQPANPETVLGDFSDVGFDYFGAKSRFYRRDGDYYVHTEDVAGSPREFRIAYTFGVEPLQQYLIEFADGRLQTLPYSWDSRPAVDGGQRWFHIYPQGHIKPGDGLHWTGREQNWNYMCAECHSTNVRLGYDEAADRFDTRYAEVSVGCEACHGPGSRHLAQANAGDFDVDHGLVVDLDDRQAAFWQMDPATGIAVRSEHRTEPPLQPETCGRCHARRGILTDVYDYGRPLAHTHRPALLDETLYFADGQILDEVFVYGSFLQSRMYAAGVTCTDCHDPHSNQLVTGDDPNAVCAQCHAPGVFAVTAHDGHPSDTVGCVDCHMTDRTYMVIDDRRDHSFRVPRPDLSASLGVPNACNDCHEDRDADWAAAAIVRWHGPDAATRPEFASTLAEGRRGHANDVLLALVSDPDQPGIARATALSLLRPPLSSEHVAGVEAAVADPDVLLRMAALRLVRGFPAEIKSQFGGAGLADPVRGVRIEAALAYAGVQDLLPAESARAFGSAERELRASLALTANRPESQAGLADFELSLGHWQAAFDRYRRALEMEPRAVVARVNFADLLRGTGDESRAERTLREGIALVEADAALRHALGLLLVRTGRADEGLEQLRTAAEAEPDNPRFLYVLGVALNSMGNAEAAVELLERGRARFAGDFDIAWALATMLRDQGESTRALAVLDELIEQFPYVPDVVTLRDSLRPN